MSTAVTTFYGPAIANRLKVILALLDAGNDLHVRGNITAFDLDREARADLQTLIAEVSE